MKLIRTITLLSLLASLTLGGSAFAADVEKKWRVSFSVGQHDATSKVDSDAANVLQIVNPDFTLAEAYIDPRNDSDAFTNLSVEPAELFTFATQYAFTPIFLLEASVGYQKGDVGDVQMTAQFARVESLPEVPFRFESYNIPAGELERIPIQLTSIVRLRPKAKFNPYFGVGLGYSVIGFDPSAELNELSRNMDQSIGVATRLTPVTDGGPVLVPVGSFGGLSGATVDATDTFEWHLVSGAEYAVKRNWSLYLDMRWVDASREFNIGFNGGQSLGVSVPQFIDFVGGGISQGPFGPVRIDNGGLIDAGTVRLVPDDSVPVSTDCTLPVNSDLCVERFFFEPDGELDPGFYYAQGGKVGYDGFSLQFGFRHTFGKK